MTHERPMTDDPAILRRMRAHQAKKRDRLRPLRVARLFPEANGHVRDG